MSITPPSLNGDTIYMGAAHICIDQTGTWEYLWAEGEVTVRLERVEAERNVAGFGVVASPTVDEMVEITFTPANKLSTAGLAYIYGDILSKMPGQSYFGTTDKPVWVHTLAGRILKVANARVTAWPALNIGVAERRFDGALTITGLLSRGVARTVANALFTPWAEAAFTALPDEDDFPIQPCAVTWAPTSSLVIEGMEAWRLTPQVTLQPRRVANLGTIDYTVMDVALEAAAVPANFAEANLWADYVLGSSRAIGSALPAGDLTLTEDNPGVTAVVKNARLAQAPTRFDPANPIAGECLWRSRRKAADGAWLPAGTLALTAAPPPPEE